MKRLHPFKYILTAFVFIAVSASTCFTTLDGPRSTALTLASKREISSVTGGLRCEGLFATQEIPPKIFSSKGLQKIRGPSGRVMMYDFLRPRRGQKVMLLIHGLGDDLFSLQRIAERAVQDGFAILRVDLHAHGATLKEYLNTHHNMLPHEFDYRDNVDDIQNLIATLDLHDLHIVGHSYGGGIALKLAEEMPKDRVTRPQANSEARPPYH
jgi:pimeloyl-ACP methyl ester carboxylesterase